MEEYKKQLNKITNAIEDIPYTSIFIDIKTETDRFTLEKYKKSNVIGFRGGANE